MSWKNVLNEFANRPREAHSIGYGAMLTYLGIYHGLTVPETGFGLEKLALVIGLTIIGLNPAAARKGIGKVLPKDMKLPEDITKETHYYWVGLTAVYIVQHLSQLVQLVF